MENIERPAVLPFVIKFTGILLIVGGVVFALMTLWDMDIAFVSWRYLCPGCSPTTWRRAQELRNMENLTLYFTLRFVGVGIAMIAGIVGIVIGCKISKNISKNLHVNVEQSQ